MVRSLLFDRLLDTLEKLAQQVNKSSEAVLPLIAGMNVCSVL